MPPHVSIIIPVYNAEAFLDRCLDSAAAQTDPEVEIICVDDASTDGSMAMLEARARADKRFRVVHREVNGGESVARNHGVAMAQGEYLAFLDHDDMLEPDACRLLYQAARAEDADIAKGRVKTVGYSGRVHLTPSVLLKRVCSMSPLYFPYEWWSAVYRTHMIQGHIEFASGYPLGGDVLFHIVALLKSIRVACVDDIVYVHIERRDSGFSQLLSFEKINSHIYICLMIIDRLHAANVQQSDPTGYLQVLWRCFRDGVVLWNRCKDDASRTMCCNFLYAVKNAHRLQDDLLINIQQRFPSLRCFFSPDDPLGLYNALLSFSPEKDSFALLRGKTASHFMRRMAVE